MIPTLFLFLGGTVCGRYDTAGCKHRGKTYETRVEQLRKDAHEQLNSGTKQDVVKQFFEAHGLPFDVFGQGDHKEAIGTVHVQGGCAPFGCGSEDALIGLRVELGLEGSLVAEPVIGSQFTNCL